MLLKKFWKLYPKSKNRKKISNERIKVNKTLRKKLQKFGKEYFDGKREHGYGGYYYNPKFFRKIVKEMIKHYKIKNGASILDIGCAKGFMMYEFKKILPKSKIYGLDISKYCKAKSIKTIKKNITVGSCTKLPYKDKYFDLVISISTIHNLSINEIPLAIKELNRVKKKNSFIRVKAYNNIKEKKFIDDWNIVAKSNLSKKSWLSIFKKYRYLGDYDFSNF
jgi:ubiquinone/menaquinone biosynthesis C-methylase UbiE